MRIALCVVTGLLFAATVCQAGTVVFEENLETAGLTIDRMTDSFVEITYRLDRVDIEDFDLGDRVMQQVSIPGIFLPNDEGAPNLPGIGRLLAVPEGATVQLDILSTSTQIVENIDVLPAPPIPREDDDSPLTYEEDPAIYSVDALYPVQAARISEIKNMRGVDVVTLGIMPFQYNPVRRELTIYSEISVRVSFQGGAGRFGEDHLRSRHWEPILQANLLNYESLSEVDFPTPDSRDNEYEYVIIVPDDPLYTAWADSIKQWRTLQGIDTGVFTLTETGATYGEIESWVNNAYGTWSTPPVAILLLADYVTNGGTTGITSPLYNSYCVSDNIYGDVDGDHLPDIVMARMTATPSTIERLVTKAINYERNPPTNPDFYQNPIMACGWQTERWFTMCTEIIYGFLANVHGKTPVREYAIYDGYPGTVWSTNSNTYMLLNYFGPSGLGYIPATPEHLDDWGGNATRLNNDINSGAFILQHRDHGGTTGWGEPDYDIYDLGGLTNNDLPFVFSINCLTGMYNMGGDCFVEAFHRMEHGALGLIGASESSYSFVNDTFVFGTYDCMWPEFDPGYPTEGLATDGSLRPAFGNTSGKYYLSTSSWPSNPDRKTLTYHLFHAHTDAFQTLYSEVPQNLTVDHMEVLPIGVPSFEVTANLGSVVALTIDGEIIGVGEGTGGPVDIPITPVMLPGVMRVTVTKANYYRYSQDVQVIVPEGPFLLLDHNAMDDSGGDADGIVDVGEPVELVTFLENLGYDQSTNTVGVLESTGDVVFSDDTETWGVIPSNETQPCDDSFKFNVAPGTPDQTEIEFTLNVTCDETTFVQEFSYVVEAPIVAMVNWWVNDDAGGDGDGRAEPGETVDLAFRLSNTGHEDAVNVTGVLQSYSHMITIDQNTAFVSAVLESWEADLTGYTVTIDPDCPEETTINLRLNISANFGYQITLQSPLPVSPFFDEFEEFLGWTTSGTASTGDWLQADPEGTIYNNEPCQPEDDHSPAPGRHCMVTGPMAGTSAGTYDVDNGSTILTSPVFDLSGAIGATLEYWRWYTNDLGEAPGQDWWTVEVSSDDGASWTHLEHTQESANYWQKLSFQLEDYIGLTDLVRVRFTAADDGSPSLVEAAVDDILLFAIREDPTDVSEEGDVARASHELMLAQNRPNPFNPVTEITYGIPAGSAPARVVMHVYDLSGRKVTTLVDTNRGPGTHHVTWDGRDHKGAEVASGVYFYRITWNGESETRRMVLLK